MISMEHEQMTLLGEKTFCAVYGVALLLALSFHICSMIAW